MNKIRLIVLLFALPFATSAQKKTFTFEQIFRGHFPEILNPLPEIGGWADNDHYIELHTDNKGNESAVSIDVLTGSSSPFLHPKSKQMTMPEIEDAQNVTLSPDGKYAAYTRKNNIYVTELTTKKETAVTTDGTEGILNGYASWIYYEEIIGRPSHYKAFWWSPDSKRIAYMRFNESKVPVFPIYFANGQHGYLEYEHYPKAGDKNPEVKIGISTINDPKTTWADFDEHKDQYFGTPQWTPANQLYVQWMNRGQDTLNVYQVSSTDGSKKLVYTETQPTWISLDDDTRIKFLSAGHGFIVKSDKNGWENLYLHDNSGKELNKITSGNLWGTEILNVDESNKMIIYTARQKSSTRFDIYKSSFDGKSTTRLSSGDYTYDDVSVSPGGKYIIAVYSNLSTPPVMALMDNKGKLVKVIRKSQTVSTEDYLLPVTKLVTVKSSDSVFDLPMTITYPVNFDSSKKYPVWINIYGGPGAGTVFDRWKPVGGLSQWWAQEGIIQVVMDNRSSGHFGKKGINYIFKKLGLWETEDYMTCAKWLKQQTWVDASKVGITGGSYGGYVTCMALTYGSDVFTHGIANYSVTDWQLYDTHYTERYMKTPQQNPDGYKKASVMSYINKYKGGLRIVHGSTDDNVHMQHSIQLIDGLQDLNKSFEFMIYPNQRHGIGNTKARHNLTETCRFIYKNMLGRDLPREFGQ
ncbi:MAG TPA: DPP IV N-terminal domain-containing protein [Flavitalea sp.]|nr:DPP IV N-terminal domain-containing protein [Flavitalea sp.]